VNSLASATLLLTVALPFTTRTALAPAAPRSPTAADSVRAVRNARSAQASFEAFRRARLPRGVARTSGACDVTIGRYCYWRGDDDDEAPPPEPAEVRARRDAFIRLLDSASDALPGDPWLAGQRVRYLVDAGDADSASRFAARCAAGPSWCAALGGFAFHEAGRFSEADSAYRHALALMDTAERCRWLDIGPLLEGELAQRFGRTDCAHREALVRQVFWLAAPLYAVSGTDALTEHFARLTWARMVEGTASEDGVSWGDDVRELVLRYGLPRWYSRDEDPFDPAPMPSIVGHDAGMPYDFLPSLHALDHLGHATDADWDLDDPAAATEYSPSFARSVHDLPGQIAVFRRGDSACVVAAWDAGADTTLLGRPLHAALVLAGDTSVVAIRRDTAAGVRGHLAVTGPLDSGLASLELLASGDRRAARTRVGVSARPAGRVTLSDLLLYAPSPTSPDALALVADRALAHLSVASAAGVGVYWEAYGVQPTDTVRYSLLVSRVDESWLHRATDLLHVSRPPASLRLAWNEVARLRDGIAGRGVNLDLSRLPAGRYRAELDAGVGGRPAVVVTRDFEVW